MHKLAITLCSAAESAEQTSELEDAIDVDGNFSLFPFLLKYQNNAILGAEKRLGGCG